MVQEGNVKEYYLQFSDRAASKRCVPAILGIRRCSDCYECPVSRCVAYSDGLIRVTANEEVARRLELAAMRKACKVAIVPVEDGRAIKDGGGSIWL